MVMIRLLAIFLLTAFVTNAQEAPWIKAIDLRSLTPEQADQSTEYRIRGTLIYKDDDNAVFLQDETAGALFWNKGPTDLTPGDILEVQGTTRSGLFVPGLEKVTFRVIGHGPMPAPIEATYDDLISGRFHYQWIFVEGVIRTVRTDELGNTTLRLAMGSRIVEIHLRDFPDAANLLDHKIRVTGMAAGGINDRYQLNQPYVWPHNRDNIEILEKPEPPEKLESIPAGTLLTFRPTARTGHRVRLSGTVLAAFGDGRVFLRQDKSALSIKLSDPQPVEPGDFIEILGFPQMETFSAILADATVVTRTPGAPPLPVPTKADTIANGSLNHELVIFNGTVVDSFRTGTGAAILLQTNGPSLRVDTPPLPDLPAAGSHIRATGICDVESTKPVNYLSKPDVISVLVQSPADLVVLRSPPWWTTGRLTIALFALAAIFALAILWIILLRRQVEKQTDALRDRIENEAMMLERQRIAREFHDTLEQDLTGLSLQLGAAAARGPGDASVSLLYTARHLVSRIQTETRNLLSDLRTPADQALDLPASLQLLADKHPGNVGPKVESQSSADLPPLPPRTIHHLRMIAQESVTNAIKHAGATLITIRLEKENDHLLLTITDNGKGFSPETETREKPGHFGCMGIRERSRKLGAEVSWESAPGQGTTVSISLPTRNPS